MIHNTTLLLIDALEADAAAHRQSCINAHPASQSELAHLRELRDQPAKGYLRSVPTGDDVEVES